MSFITEILNNFKKCCCPFLTTNQQLDSMKNITDPLIEMQQYQGLRKNSYTSNKKSRKRTGSRISAPKQMEDSDQVKESGEKMVQSTDVAKSKIQIVLKNGNHDQASMEAEEKPFNCRRVQSGIIRSSQKKSQSQSSFQTIKSTASRPISRRNFKLLRKSSNFFAKHRSIQEDFYSVNQSQNSSMDQNHIHRVIHFKFDDNYETNRDGIDMMNVWMKKEYEVYPNKGYKPSLNEITKMKLQTKDSFDSLVHKLQDYYTFYYQDQQLIQQEATLNIVKNNSNPAMYQQNSLEAINKPPAPLLSRFAQPHSFPSQQPLPQLCHYYEQKNQQMICSITLTDCTRSFDYQKNCKYMSLIILPSCSLSPLKFIQWFNQMQVQGALHCFNKIWYLQNSQRVNDKVTMEYPLVKVEQFNEKLAGKIGFLMARQIEVVKFQNQDDKETLLEICFEAMDQGKCFERLVRVTAEGKDSCRVEIYIQSSQNIMKKPTNPEGIHTTLKNHTNAQNYKQKQPQFQYFEQRWKKFQQKMNNDRVINNKKIQVFAN